MEANLVLSKCELSRWRFDSRRRGVAFVFILIVLFPYACSDDSNSVHSSTQNNAYQHVNINITFADLETRKEANKFYDGIYGRQSIISSASGIVMHAMNIVNKSGAPPTVNNFGCTSYSNKKFPSESWIALVERGECSFANKIRIATKDHNASAIAIYNNITTANGPTLMEHDQASSSIAVLLLKENGKEIVHLLDKGYTVYMHLKPGKKDHLGGVLPNSISKTSVLFVSISFIVLMIVSLAWLVFYYIQRFRYSHAKEILARRLACAAKKAITKIPQRTLKMGDKELDSDHDQCAVCIEPYKFHEVIRILPCRHIFHKSCVDPWLLDQRTCPMCKMDILRAYGMQIGGSQESLHPDPDVVARSATVAHEDPEISSSVDDNQTDSVKVTLVPHSCLHFCHANEKADYDEQTSDDLRGAVGGIVPPSPSTNSLTSKGISFSRAEKSDKTDSINSEMKSLIWKGKDKKRRWKSEEAFTVPDREIDFLNVTKNPGSVVAQSEI